MFLLYLDRWPIEQVSFVTKQLWAVSAVRICPHMLPVLSRSSPAGDELAPPAKWFLDRQRCHTTGWLRRVLAATDFSKVAETRVIESFKKYYHQFILSTKGTIEGEL